MSYETSYIQFEKGWTQIKSKKRQIQSKKDRNQTQILTKSDQKVTRIDQIQPEIFAFLFADPINDKHFFVNSLNISYDRESLKEQESNWVRKRSEKEWIEKNQPVISFQFKFNLCFCLNFVDFTEMFFCMLERRTTISPISCQYLFHAAQFLLTILRHSR